MRGDVEGRGGQGCTVEVIEISGSRGFYYDDARSLDRWNREWSQSTPAAWSLIYSAPFFAYRNTNLVANDRATLMSFVPSRDREITAKIRTSDIVNDGIGIYLRKSRTTLEADQSSVLWNYYNGNHVILVYDAGAFVVLATAALVLVANSWYNVKLRAQGQTFRAKVWLLGTAEPNWQLTTYMTRQQARGQDIGQSTICLRAGGTLAGLRDYADLRVSPVRKVGGP